MKSIMVSVVGLVVTMAPIVQQTVPTRTTLPTLRYSYPKSEFYSSEWCQDGLRSLLVKPGGGKAMNCARATGAELPISGPLEMKE